MSRPDITMREVLLADVYEAEIDDIKDRLAQAIDMRNKYSSQNAILREALKFLTRDDEFSDDTNEYAKQALQRAGGGE